MVSIRVILNLSIHKQLQYFYDTVARPKGPQGDQILPKEAITYNPVMTDEWAKCEISNHNPMTGGSSSASSSCESLLL